MWQLSKALGLTQQIVADQIGGAAQVQHLQALAEYGLLMECPPKEQWPHLDCCRVPADSGQGRHRAEQPVYPHLSWGQQTLIISMGQTSR